MQSKIFNLIALPKRCRNSPASVLGTSTNSKKRYSRIKAKKQDFYWYAPFCAYRTQITEELKGKLRKNSCNLWKILLSSREKSERYAMVEQTSKIRLSFIIKLILFLSVCWIVVPAALEGLVVMPKIFTIAETIGKIPFFLINLFFFVLINFPCKIYTRLQKIICFLIAVIETLAWCYILMISMGV